MPTPRLSDLPPPPPDKTGWPWTEESPPLHSTPPEGTPWPKVSIVTPSLNQGQFIEETIRSVLLQGYPDLEYLVVDGGSTDSTIDIVRKYGKWISHWESETDRGQSHAINKGFARANGEIVAWLNSDDFYLPGAVAAAARFLTAHPEAALVYGQVRVADSMSTSLYVSPLRRFVLKKAFLENRVPQPATFMLASAVRAAGNLNESYHFSMDYDLWLRLTMLGSILSKPEPWAAFRWHPGSKTHSRRDAAWEERSRILNSLLLNPEWQTYRLAITRGVGYSHWMASLASWARHDEDSSARHAREAVRLYPQFIHSYYLPNRIASALSNGPTDNPTGVPQEYLTRAAHYFDLVPESVSMKRRALRRVAAFLHTALAVQTGSPFRRRLLHAWLGFTTEPIFVAMLVARKLLRGASRLGRGPAFGQKIA